jgi:hypothetical protein
MYRAVESFLRKKSKIGFPWLYYIDVPMRIGKIFGNNKIYQVLFQKFFIFSPHRHAIVKIEKNRENSHLNRSQRI